MIQEDLSDDNYQRIDDKQIGQDIMLADLDSCKKSIGKSLIPMWRQLTELKHQKVKVPKFLNKMLGSYLGLRVYSKFISFEEFTENSKNSESEDIDPELIEKEDFDNMVGVLSRLYISNSIEN